MLTNWKITIPEKTKIGKKVFPFSIKSSVNRPHSGFNSFEPPQVYIPGYLRNIIFSQEVRVAWPPCKSAPCITVPVEITISGNAMRP